MDFIVDTELLDQSRTILAIHKRLFWIIGGAGSGKSTVSRTLAERFDIPVYDMDAHIYGTYHGRFLTERHPVNTAWARSENGLAWLLGLSWEEFDAFHRAALPEYLDLLCEDIGSHDPNATLLIDGGVYHAALLAQVLSHRQILCLETPECSSADVWEGSAERRQMQEMVLNVAGSEADWRKFLEFDKRISSTILAESRLADIPIVTRYIADSVDQTVDSVIHALGL